MNLEPRGNALKRKRGKQEIRPHHAPSHKEAVKQGVSRYSGKPCKYGHTLRYTVTKMCVSCRSRHDRNIRRRKNGPSKMIEIDRSKKEANFLDDYYRM